MTDENLYKAVTEFALKAGLKCECDQKLSEDKTTFIESIPVDCDQSDLKLLEIRSVCCPNCFQRNLERNQFAADLARGKYRYIVRTCDTVYHL